MPDLPDLPTLPQQPYDFLVGVFADMAQRRGLAGPVEAYVEWSIGNLLDLARNTAYAAVDAEVATLRAQRAADVEAVLASWTDPP